MWWCISFSNHALAAIWTLTVPSPSQAHLAMQVCGMTGGHLFHFPMSNAFQTLPIKHFDMSHTHRATSSDITCCAKWGLYMVALGCRDGSLVLWDTFSCMTHQRLPLHKHAITCCDTYGRPWLCTGPKVEPLLVVGDASGLVSYWGVRGTLRNFKRQVTLIIGAVVCVLKPADGHAVVRRC
jgi:hypothetical protein